MPRYKRNERQNLMVPVNLNDQLITGTIELRSTGSSITRLMYRGLITCTLTMRPAARLTIRRRC